MAASLGLSTYRWNNNLKSVLLLLAFPVLLLVLLGVLFLLFSWFFLADPSGLVSPYIFQSYGLAPLTGGYGVFDFGLAAMRAYWPYVLGAAVLWLVLAYLFNDAMIHRATGARPVTRAEAPRAYNLLETLCISRGLTMPKLYIIETDALNAYATGIDRRTYSVTVTSGLLARLDDRELEAVLGHELTHIIDHDVRLLLITIVFVGAISFLAQLLWRNMIVASYQRGRRSGNLSLFALLAAAIAAIGYVLALLLRFAISRRREYLADAGSVALTKNPEALISALRKIAENPDVPHVPSEVRQMFIENSPASAGFLDLFATHPPIEARIRVLEQLEGVPHHDSGSVPAAGHWHQ